MPELEAALAATEGVGQAGVGPDDHQGLVAFLPGDTGLKGRTDLVDAGGKAVILSTDKIYLQLLSEHVAVRDHFKPADLDREYVAGRFGVAPETFVDFLALAGDSTNSIGGVPGIGPKIAAAKSSRTIMIIRMP